MQKYKYIFSILAVLFLFKTQARAQTASDMEEFSRTHARNWQFDCNIENFDAKENQQFLEFYEAKAKESVFRGLADLRRLNWDLYVAVYQRTFEKKLIWGCDFKSFMNNGAAAYFNKYPIGFKGIRLGVAAAGYGLNCLNKRGECQDFRNTLLHEFYHYAGLDSQNVFAHGKHNIDWGETERKTQDVIYACAAQTFPSKSFLLEFSNGGEVYLNNKRVCSLCAAAVPKSGRWGTDVDVEAINAGYVADSCSTMDQEKSLYGWYTRKGDQLVLETVETRKIMQEFEARMAALQAESEKIRAQISGRSYVVTRKKKN